MYMTPGGLFGRVALQLLCGFVLVALAGGGLVWVVALFFLIPAIAMSVFIFAPIECVAVLFGVRWVAWIVTPARHSLAIRVHCAEPDQFSGSHLATMFRVRCNGRSLDNIVSDSRVLAAAAFARQTAIRLSPSWPNLLNQN
jgi:hypothetical protein